MTPSVVRECRAGPLARPLALLLSLCWLAGCGNAGYYLQAVSGQLELMAHRTPIRELLADPDTDPELGRRLELVLQVREFASRDMLLPDNDSYRSYVALDREHVVWNVFAAPEFSVQAKTWCFPVAGCVAYRGYFDEDRAQAYAGELAREGYDVYVGGVAAYSTLGRFDDPVLSTMMRWGDTRLAAVIFHELAHQMLYVEGDTGFNESFASLVEQEAVSRWLRQTGREDALADYRLGIERAGEFAALVIGAREALAQVYATDVGPVQWRARKQAVLQDLRQDYQALRASWDGWSGYDGWFSRDLNNAHLVSVAAYQAWVPAFRTLLARQDGDLARFYQSARELAAQPAEQRTRALTSLAEDAANRSVARP